MSKLPAFKGKSLIEIPETNLYIGFLGGDFGKAFFEEYQKRVNSDYDGNAYLRILEYKDGVVKGSNTFAVVLANQILRQEGLRTATQADLEKIIKTRVLNLHGFIEDTGLVLRSEEDKKYSENTPLARYLGFQLRKRGMKFNPKNPVMMPLTGFELENSDNYYGLTFKLKEDAEISNTRRLNKAGKFNSKDIEEEIGLPNRVRNFGERILYVRDSGLSGLWMNYRLDIGSANWLLAGSYDIGRIVVISEEKPKKL